MRKIHKIDKLKDKENKKLQMAMDRFQLLVVQQHQRIESLDEQVAIKESIFEAEC